MIPHIFIHKKGFDLKEVTAVIRVCVKDVKTGHMEKRSGAVFWETFIAEISEIKSIHIVAIDYFENYGRSFFGKGS